MRTHHTIAVCAIAVATVVVGACNRLDRTAGAVDQAPGVSIREQGTPGGHFDVSAGALATRQEAQDDLDAAREALDRHDAAAASASLRTASLFYARLAARRDVPARDRLATVAAELKALSVKVGGGMGIRDSAIDAVLIRANVAEAENHRLQALSAWGLGNRSNAADELVMAVDHLERALAAARLATPDARRVLDDARQTATALLRESTLAPGAVDAAVTGLAKEIQLLDRGAQV